MAGGQFLMILFLCGVSAAIVARWKGNSVFLWFMIGAGLPIMGTIAAYLYRSERSDGRRTCPTCGEIVSITNQICLGCGTDLAFPEPDEIVPAR